MLQRSLSEVSSLIDGGIQEEDPGTPIFRRTGYRAEALDVRRFHAIDETPRSRRIAAVDGGNLEVLRAPNFSVHFLRLAWNLFDGSQRVHPKHVPQRIEVFSVARVRVERGAPAFDVHLVPTREEDRPYLPRAEDLTFSASDPQMIAGKYRMTLGDVGGYARRFAEWRLASAVLEEELSPGDLLLRDGTLLTATPNEGHYARRLFESSLDRGAIPVALAKTSAVLTTTGLSLLAAVQVLARQSGVRAPWYYHPVVDHDHTDHRGEVIICQLHDQSEHAFRLEVFDEQWHRLDEKGRASLFDALAASARDMAYPGYPYPLVDSDLRARVIETERDLLRTMFQSQFAGRGAWRKVRPQLAALSGHDDMAEQS